ncbi:Ppx/GppA phosphatase family protein [Ferrimonas marina]|uniref:Ppx/GppA phosphatase n=1 Tax=Ferrimonas marina TaxID=299255 RepID=A0A1M5XYK5_9GAMM|nr:hypothetical protein [Ferrimonas marina]SHI04333.1 Ppx/GppA phosphatase [Ferrimonas marina]
MAGASVATADLPAHGGPLLAAITLGSNSFNMLLAQPGQPMPAILAKFKRKVRLADGLTAGQPLAPHARQSGLDCLAWFGEILSHYQPQQVVVYATAALRQASDSEAFCAQALPLLGHPIEVISGEQEAEYIFHGMRATTQTPGAAMMIDIGGASTELVVGEQQIDFKHSLPLGAVLYSHRYFATGVTAEGFRQAEQAVAEALAPLQTELQGLNWQQVLGVSGTVRSLFELAEQRAEPIASIDLAYLQRVSAELIQRGDAALPGLDPERVPTFAAGVAILQALFLQLGLNQLHLAGGALREGVLVALDRRWRALQSAY